MLSLVKNCRISRNFNYKNNNNKLIYRKTVVLINLKLCKTVTKGMLSFLLIETV